jgi:hypothetical protein
MHESPDDDGRRGYGSFCDPRVAGAEEIIRSSGKSGYPEAQRRAEDLVDLLDSRRYFLFGELLKEPVE